MYAQGPSPGLRILCCPLPARYKWDSEVGLCQLHHQTTHNALGLLRRSYSLGPTETSLPRPDSSSLTALPLLLSPLLLTGPFHSPEVTVGCGGTSLSFSVEPGRLMNSSSTADWLCDLEWLASPL